MLREMNTAKFSFIASVVAMAGLIAALAWLSGGIGGGGDLAGGNSGAAGGDTLIVYCAAALRVPVEAAAAEYERAYGGRVQLQYGGSQTLLANLKLSGVGDLYLPAEDAYVELARNQGLVAEIIPLATMRPVLAVKAGNPRRIRTLDDLLATNDLTLALADPDAAAIGRLTREALQAAGKWEAVRGRAAVLKPTVTEVATDVKLGAADAGFVWDATVSQFTPALEAIELPELAGRTAQVSVCVLKSAKQPTNALRFASFLSAPDKGRPHFERAGLNPLADHAWTEDR